MKEIEILQFDFFGQGEPDIAQTVYDSLHGFLIPTCSLPWVEPVFQPGLPAHDNYGQMLRIKSRIAARLGCSSEDRDLEAMTDYLLAYSKTISLEMFRCGQTYQKLLDEK